MGAGPQARRCVQPPSARSLWQRPESAFVLQSGLVLLYVSSSPFDPKATTHLHPANARNQNPHSRRSLCEAPLDCLANGFVIIACAACDKIVCAIKEGIVAYRV